MSYKKLPNNLLETIKKEWDQFKAIHNRYPTSQEIDRDKNMISTRTMQRKFGGVMEVRKMLGHEISNYSAGQTRVNTAILFNKRSDEEEFKVANFLIETFGKRPNVCGQEPYEEYNGRVRSDYGVYTQNGKHFFVDVFYAQDQQSLVGCINYKQKKIIDKKIDDTIYYVSSNDEVISQLVIDKTIKNKKNKLPDNVKVLTFDNFKKECYNIFIC